MNTLIAFVTGIIFGIGLIISGMVFPEKVIDFLDITGAWDPSLGLVMVGAILVGVIAFTIAKKRQKTYLGFAINLLKSNKINPRLIIGSLIFGVGWGLAGLCPGPAIVNLGTANSKVIVFVLAMLVGMIIFEVIANIREKKL